MTNALELAYEKAAFSCKFDPCRLERAYRLLLHRQNQVGDGWIEIASDSEGWRRIAVQGGRIGPCDCKDYKLNKRANGGWCAHRIGVALLLRATEIEIANKALYEVNALCERERKESKALNSEVESGYESWL